MSFCQRFLELMLTRQERAQERNRPRGSFGVLAPFFEESNYKFTNIPLTVAFKMFFFLFYLFLLNTFIYETLNGIVFRSFPLSALSAQQVKSRTKHFSSRFKGKPSPAVARIWWIFHVFVFVFIFWKQTFLYCCCCFLFREKAAPKAKLRRRKCSWNSPKFQSFQRFNFFRSRKDCEKNCLYEHQRRGKGCRRVENSCEICKHTRRKRNLVKSFRVEEKE